MICWSAPQRVQISGCVDMKSSARSVTWRLGSSIDALHCHTAALPRRRGPLRGIRGFARGNCVLPVCIDYKSSTLSGTRSLSSRTNLCRRRLDPVGHPHKRSEAFKSSGKIPPMPVILSACIHVNSSVGFQQPSIFSAQRM